MIEIFLPHFKTETFIKSTQNVIFYFLKKTVCFCSTSNISILKLMIDNSKNIDLGIL